MEYVVEAEVTTCTPTQDYFFTWSVQSSFASPLREDTSGCRLEIPPHSLEAGASYYVTCAVYRNSGEFVTQTGLPLQVLYRGLTVSLNFDVMVVTVNNGFDVNAVFENYDYYREEVEFEWSCNYENELCEEFESTNTSTLSLFRGFRHLGQYKVTLDVTVHDQQASSNATVIVIEPALPVIEVKPQRRVVNEDSMVTLVANVTSVAPPCTLTWYFADKEYLASLNYSACDDCQHGKELPGSITITSIEENFLNELADFTNDTESRQVEAQMIASNGRARFVAQCECSLTFNCNNQGFVYTDVNLKLNESPKITEIKVSPETGMAMETVFRLSTLAASDPEKPLRYSFYCSLGANETLMLASNLEHLAAESFLPYIGSAGTHVWVEVCDSLGACSSSEVRRVQVQAGEGRTVAALVDSMRGLVARCEGMFLRRLVQSAVSTYMNTNQEEVLSRFTKALLEALSTTDGRCIKNNLDYSKLLDWLIRTGVNTSSLIE